MSLLKIIIGFLVIGSIAVIINEIVKRRNKKAKHAKLINELENVQDQLIGADVEETVLDAKTKLKGRRATLNAKETALEVEPAPVKKKTVKKTAKKKVVKKKAAPKKKVVKKKVTPKSKK